MKAHAVQKLSGKPVIIITLTSRVGPQDVSSIQEQLARHLPGIGGDLYLIYDATLLKLTLEQLLALTSEVAGNIAASGNVSHIQTVIVGSNGLLKRADALIHQGTAEEPEVALFPSLDQALAYTSAALV